MDIEKRKWSEEHYAKYLQIHKDQEEAIIKSETEEKYAGNIAGITQKWIEDLYNLNKEIGEEAFNICEQRYIEENPPIQEYVSFSRA
jgi:hypothetical protein